MTCCTSTTRKARKAHRCDWCNESIEKGTAYVDHSGFGDDGAFHCRLHIECDNAIRAYTADDNAEWYDLEEIYGNGLRGHCHEPNDETLLCIGCIGE